MCAKSFAFWKHVFLIASIAPPKYRIRTSEAEFQDDPIRLRISD